MPPSGGVVVVTRDRAGAERLGDRLRWATGRPVTVMAAPQALELLRRASDAADAVVLAPDLAAPVRIAQELGAHAHELPVIVLAPPDRVEVVRRDLRFAPFLGEEVRVRAATQDEDLAADVAAAADRGSRRREHQVTVRAAQRQLAGPVAPGRHVASYLGHLLDHVPVGVLAVDEEGTVVTVNRAAAELLAIQDGQVTGRPLDELLPAATADALRAAAAGAGGDGPSPVMELPPAGRLVEVTASSYAGPLDERRTVLVLVDVTERVHVERDRERTSERLRRLQAVTDAALSHLALDDLLHELLGRIRSLLAVETATVLLVEPSSGALTVRATRGRGAGAAPDLAGRPGTDLASRVAAQRRPLRLADAAGEAAAHGAGAPASLAVPLMVTGRVLGVLEVASRESRGFTDEDEQLLSLVADRAALAIEQARAYEREHETAVTLQRSLLPDSLPATAGLRLSARYLPAAESAVGGDWYDAFALDDGALFLVIGDVVGRGVPAASLMGQLRNAARAYALDGHGPASVAERLRRFVELLLPDAMATIALAQVDAGTGDMRFFRAGHLPPVVLDAGGAGRLLKGGASPPLGAPVPGRGDDAVTRLAPGDTLVLCSDGLVERRDESLEQGLERLMREAARGPRDPEALCDHLVGRMAGGGAGEDDVAVLVVRRVSSEPLVCTVPAQPRELAGVRRALGDWLADAGAGPEEVHAVVLAAAEACSNAIRHASPSPLDCFELHADREDDEVVIVVRDHGRWRAGPRPDGGRGLPLMRALVDRVDIARAPQGTTVTLRRRLERPSVCDPFDT